MAKKSMDKRQYGDFQTPIELARKIVNVLKHNHCIEPNIIIEPTCGKGTFIQASHEVFGNSHILGFDINKEYVTVARSIMDGFSNRKSIEIIEADFFSTDWQKILSGLGGYLLIIGNPPWVTSSELGILNSKNLPEKSNFQNRRGIEAITGSANFDISEWMLLEHLKWLSNRDGTIALLCKYSVARKVIRQIRNVTNALFEGHIYPVDAKKYFGASVEACLFILIKDKSNADCKVYESLESDKPSHIIGEREGFIINDVEMYERWRHLRGQDNIYVWRSGVKHDCSKVMELEPVNGGFTNGLGEYAFIENEYIYPLLKSSDIGNGRTNTFRKFVLLTQKSVGEDTSDIKKFAPNTWKYLQEHREYFDNRKSAIYKNKPDFSIFGVGTYSFKNWKIAISGLYKKLAFHLVGPLNGKTVAFDDTIYFLSFDTEEEANFVKYLLNSKPAIEFLKSMIFWEDKRPITKDILKRLSLKKVAKELGKLEKYYYYAEMQPSNIGGQLKLGVSDKKASYKKI